MIPKILIIPPGIEGGWYMENHAEYLIRELSDEFFIEVADVPYPPYDDFLDRFPETNPFQRNPDDYDLLWPLLPTHWVVTDKDKYAHKTATVFYQPNEGRFQDVAVVGAANPKAYKELSDTNTKYFKLRFGVDINHFKPLLHKREDDLLHVGMVGNLYNPRRMVPDVVEVLKDVYGIKIMLFLNQAPQTDHDIDLLGGAKNVKYIVSGSKGWAGLPNLYNRLDVLIRCDSDPGVSFPVMEAAACGVPVIATDSGIDHIITEAGGGYLIKGDRSYYQSNPTEVAEKVREHVIYFRDHPVERLKMGIKARLEIITNWTWEDQILEWREFFREGIKNASYQKN